MRRQPLLLTSAEQTVHLAHLAFAMKQAMNTPQNHGLWLVLGTLLFSTGCAARELSLYRVDGNEGNVRLHRTGHSSAAENVFIDDSPKESYVRAAVVNPTEKDAMYRSEEAKLQQERRLMFFRNLQLGSVAPSLSFSLPNSSGEVPEDTYQIGTTWEVLNSALDGDASRLGEPEVSDTDLLNELVDQASAYAGFETEEQEQVQPPQLRGGAPKTPKIKGANKAPKKIKGEKSTKTKTPKSKATKSKKADKKLKGEKTKNAKTPKSKAAKSKKADKKLKSEKIKKTKTPKSKATKGTKGAKAPEVKVAKSKKLTKQGGKKASEKKVKLVKTKKAPKGVRVRR